MLILLVSFVVTVSLAPLVRTALLRRGVLDIPNERSSHGIPVPRGGGIASLGGTLVALVFVAFRHEDAPWLVLAVAGALGLVGLVDDYKSLPATVRLAAQIAAGTIMGAFVGGGWWVALGAVAIPFIVNVVNFMDGINGITSLTMAVWGATALVLGQTQAVPSLSLVGALAAGSALGFLPWNFPAARLFLGDVGSYLFGGIAAAGLLIGWHGGVPVVILAAPLTLYVIDTMTVLAKRVVRGDSLFVAHREHVYQRLVNDSALSHAVVSLTVGGLSIIITVAWLPGSYLLGTIVTALVATAYLLSPRVLARRLAFGTDTSRKAESK